MCHLRDSTGWRLVSGLIAVGLGCLALSACGGSSDNATTLLKQTFGGAHKVNSGKLDIVLTVDPSGSTTLKSPITLSFGGPFQSLGTGSSRSRTSTSASTAEAAAARSASSRRVPRGM